MLTPLYPTIAEAEAAAMTLGTAIVNQKLDTTEDVQAAYICVGYGLSLGFGTPRADTHMLTAMSPHIALDWKSLVALLLQLLAGALKP